MPQYGWNVSDLTGKRFGLLTVIERVWPNRHHKSVWRCRCDCGEMTDIVGSSLTGGLSQSCGCRVNRTPGAKLKHGALQTLEYCSWTSMKARCLNPGAAHYDRYGGRGITICERWQKSFADFLADVGPRPTAAHTLERIDNDGNYEPGNVRWATRYEQAQNRSAPRKRSTNSGRFT